MSDDRPIGVFDSGLGGLTVVREILRLMPAESVVYLGDTARCPYGTRSDAVICSFGNDDAAFLCSQDIKMLIVACNTVSSVALESIRARVTDIPVIGVVIPGAKAAVEHTANKKIGVIGTSATIRTGSYAKSIAAIDPSIKVFQKACPLFVPLVEEGLVDHDLTRRAVQHYLYELVDSGIDCLILGCTHYPLMLEVILETVGNDIEVLDSAFWTAREAKEILAALNTFSLPRDGLAASRFLITDETPHFRESAQRFLGVALPVVEHIGLDILCRQPGSSATS